MNRFFEKCACLSREHRKLGPAVVLGTALWTFAVPAVCQAVGEGQPTLPITNGLDVWFDAAQVPNSSASNTNGQGVPIEKWVDVSNQHRAAVQPNPDARPHLITIGASTVLRFDGVDDNLRLSGLDRSLESATLFVVAAARSNLGGFRAFLAANETDRRDFETGFTVDLGPFPTTVFSQLNVEGRGFTGAQSLLRDASPLGTLHVIEVTVDPGRKSVDLRIDGQAQGSRPFNPETLRMDELTLGARYYNLGPGPQSVTGFGAVDIAEVVVYGRKLEEDEARSVREHLLKKHAELIEELPRTLLAEGGVPLESIPHPPAMQVFAPGFEVRELPLELPNINNVRYRPDGALVALAYDGDVYLLRDTDGDGLEDQAGLFWENGGRIRSPIGMALTPAGYALGEGLIMATKTKCLLVVDTDGDHQADREVTVAEGWAESFHNVDALGVAIDPQDHSIYFGLGTANFADPLLRDKEGVPHYRLDGERGAVLKVSADFQQRETFCTGIRFPVGLAFNRYGDLFGTDQEGATWVPNGNPLDELLHLQRGRHYGFPARHPEFLPNVIDEPSTYDYSPQHQSTCGLIFNEPINGGPPFGPDFWTGDAFVCGYSRGKLFRTKVVKTPLGYVADNRLLACLNMLTVDSCVTPQGGLIVAVHSGGPDWGSGPSGRGKLYHVSYVDRGAPQPAAAWTVGPNEVQIAFDRPLEAEHLHGLAGATRIAYGEYVRAGDEFESLRPGYEVVARQMSTPRYQLAVHSAQVTPDRRVLVLVTDPQTQPVHYAVQLPGMGRPGLIESKNKRPGDVLPQLPRVDLDYSLQGVSAEWKSDNNNWSGWLPHLDPSISSELTAGSAPHEEFSKVIKSEGELTLRTQLELSNMLHPAVQPGSKLDYSLPPERVTVRFESSAPFALAAGGKETAASPRGETYIATAEHRADTQLSVPIEIRLKKGAGKLRFTIAWHTNEDDRPRPLQLHRMLVPWAAPRNASPVEAGPRVIGELAGGSWARGRKVFFSEQALCSKCHSIRGLGEQVGPDLSNLVHRDYASVLRDVTQPSYAVNPDYITHTVALADGRILSGTLRNAGDELLISDTQGKVTKVKRSDVESSVPAAKSIMPDDIIKRLPPDQLRDLLTFLLMPPPHMPLDNPQVPPPMRSPAEVEAVLAGAPDPPDPARPISIVLVAGAKDHGPGEHDYPAWQKAWAELLSVDDQTYVSTAWDWPSEEDFRTADVLVFYQHGTWTPQRARDVDAFLKRGGGLVYIHYAVDGGPDAPGFAQRIGLAWQGGRSKFRHGPLELGFETGERHPIARNFSQVKLVDESYWDLVASGPEADILATAVEEGKPQPLFWTLQPSRGRVFVSIPGHYSWTFDDPLFRILLLRGIAWTANEPVDRFNGLVLIGARVSPGAPKGVE